MTVPLPGQRPQHFPSSPPLDWPPRGQSHPEELGSSQRWFLAEREPDKIISLRKSNKCGVRVRLGEGRA